MHQFYCARLLVVTRFLSLDVTVCDVKQLNKPKKSLKKGHFHLFEQFFRSVNICSVPGEKKNRSVDIFAIIENNGEESWSDKGNPSYCRKCGFTLFRKWMNLPY